MRIVGGLWRLVVLAGIVGVFTAPEIANAQVPTLEMQTSTGGPAGNGPTAANQAVTFRRNTNNPAGNTFAAQTPAVTVTYSLSNQQYSMLTTETPSQAGVSFGANINNTGILSPGLAIYMAQGGIGGGTNAQFTSSGTSAAGQGLDVSLNGGIEIFASARALANAGRATNARWQMADLTLTFSRSVTNPIVHFSGLGAQVGGTTTSLGISAEYDLITPGLSLTELSGNAALVTSTTSVTNSSTAPNAACGTANQAACGSVRVNGTMTAVTFRMFMRGDGGTTSWLGVAGSLRHPGDGHLIGVSINLQPRLRLAKSIPNGRIAAADQFVLNINGPRGGVATLATATTTGTTTTPTEIADFFPGDGGGIYTLSEAMAAGSGSVIARYASTIACTNATAGSTTVLPTGAGVTFNVTPGVDDDISCTLANAFQTADLSVTKTNTPASGSVDLPNDTLVAGANTTYTIRVTNGGPGTVIGAIVRDTPSPNLTCGPGSVSCTPAAACAGPYTIASLTSAAGITLGTLAASTTAELTFSCTVN